MPTFLSDGLTMPKFRKRCYVKKYGAEVVSRAETAGHYHDLKIDEEQTPDEARAGMFWFMVELELPPDMISEIIYWLYIYDSLPSLMKKAFNKAFAGTQKEVTL